MIISSTALPQEAAPQISYFNVDDWKITLQRFIKGKGPAVSQPVWDSNSSSVKCFDPASPQDVIAVLQIYTAIESMVDAARSDPVVQNLVRH